MTDNSLRLALAKAEKSMRAQAAALGITGDALTAGMAAFRAAWRASAEKSQPTTDTRVHDATCWRFCGDPECFDHSCTYDD